MHDVYKINVPANSIMSISMNGTGGNADLYLYPPGTSNVDTDAFANSSTTNGNNEVIQETILLCCEWYIDVYAYQGTTNYNVTVTLSDAREGDTKIAATPLPYQR